MLDRFQFPLALSISFIVWYCVDDVLSAHFAATCALIRMILERDPENIQSDRWNARRRKKQQFASLFEITSNNQLMLFTSRSRLIIFIWLMTRRMCCSNKNKFGERLRLIFNRPLFDSLGDQNSTVFVIWEVFWDILFRKMSASCRRYVKLT
jgi:hypothetical protein